MIYLHGGLTFVRQNEICDLTATYLLLQLLSTDVMIPELIHMQEAFGGIWQSASLM